MVDVNDKFTRQSGEDQSTHFARLARELWGCVDEIKRITVPQLERRLDGFERTMDRLHFDRERDLAVRAEEQKATENWRRETRSRLELVENQVEAIRLSTGTKKSSNSLFEVDFKTLVLIATAVGAVVYEVLRRSTLP